MAKIKAGSTEISLKNRSQIREVCRSLGVAFSCNSGVCGACKIEILNGKENLSNLTQQEKDMEFSDKERLACQCTIIKGNVKIKIKNLEV